MKFFVECGVDPLFKDKISQTALYYAAREGKVECTNYLLDQGCGINDKDFYIQTPIYYAARYIKLFYIFLN